MAKHKYIDGCKDKCGACNLCCLSVCEKCGLFEGVLTTDCPGNGVSYEKSDEIYKGEINFRGGIWIKECSEHSPAFFRKHAKEWRTQQSQSQESLHVDS